jgi:type II secretory pathway component PulF
MSQAKSPSMVPITLDQLIALNDEIAALARAGVPLEQGLSALGGDMPGRLGAMASTLADRANRGEPLLQVLADPSLRLPPVYRSVVEAGLRTGRLPAALESLAAALRRLAEARRAVLAAALYPLMVLLLACCAFAFFCHLIAPRIWAGLEMIQVPGRFAFFPLVWLGQSAVYWGLLFPVAILVLALAWWHRSRRALILMPGWSHALFDWLPWIGPTLEISRTAAFTEVLALLLESRVPLHEGIVLAAESCGDRRLLKAARRMSAALLRGETAAAASSGFPPFLRWLMGAGERQEAMLPALRHASESYRRRAQYQADLTRVLLPSLLTIVIGGGATLLYALAYFVPYTSMLRAFQGGLP